MSTTPEPVEADDVADYWAPEPLDNGAVAEWWAQQPESNTSGMVSS